VIIGNGGWGITGGRYTKFCDSKISGGARTTASRVYPFAVWHLKQTI